MDTGQVLIESACSVERAEEALDALLPLVDGIRYFRFNPGWLNISFLHITIKIKDLSQQPNREKPIDHDVMHTVVV